MGTRVPCGIDGFYKTIKVEFRREMQVPHDNGKDIESTGCNFCDILTHTLMETRKGGQYRQQMNEGYYVARHFDAVSLYKLEFCFEYKIMFLKEHPFGDVLSTRSMMLDRFVMQHEEISNPFSLLWVAVLPGQYRYSKTKTRDSMSDQKV